MAACERQTKNGFMVGWLPEEEGSGAVKIKGTEYTVTEDGLVWAVGTQRKHGSCITEVCI